MIAGGTPLGKSRARVMLAFLRERGSDGAIDEEGIRVLVESVTVQKAGGVMVSMVRLKDGSEMVGE